MNGINSCSITNKKDVNSNPSGGEVVGIGLNIQWQDGPLGQGIERKEPNGAFVETVISAVIQRLEYFQGSKFNCRENALAITKLQEALFWLEHRTKTRQFLGTEGTHKV